MALAIATVTASIAGLSVSGVTFCDTSAIPPNVGDTRKQVFFPEPENFITDFSMKRDSTGMSNAKMTVQYTLNYTYWHVSLGGGRTGLDEYDTLVARWAAIVDAILASDTLSGCVDFEVPHVSEFGVVPDPSGNLGLGFRFPIRITEFVN